MNLQQRNRRVNIALVCILSIEWCKFVELHKLQWYNIDKQVRPLTYLYLPNSLSFYKELGKYSKT
jgi:hypothetical protein